MLSNSEKTRYFGFAQFRFVIAAVLLLAAGLKAYQLATAPLPPVVQGSMFTPLLELLDNRYFQMVVVVGEILFALVLIADLWRSWMWLLSLIGFTAFTFVSVIKGLSGEASCGCFGTVTVNPWYTAIFDAVIVGLLLVFRPPKSGAALAPRLNRKKVLAVLIAWFVLAVPTLFAMLSLTYSQATLGREYTALDGRRTIELEPKRWLGKEFPLIARFTEPAGSEALRQGTWSVLLVQSDCPACAKKMEEWEKEKPENVAIVVIPSGAGRIASTSLPVFWLDKQNGWSAATPCMLELSEGICMDVVAYVR